MTLCTSKHAVAGFLGQQRAFVILRREAPKNPVVRRSPTPEVMRFEAPVLHH